MAVLSVSPLILPAGSGLRRRHVVSERHRPPGDDPDYDDTTLAYDCVHVPGARSVVLVCPRLLNLGPLLRRGGVSIDGKAAPIARWRRFARYEEIWIAAPSERPEEISVRLGDLTLGAGISRREDLFDRRRVLLTLQKDEPLEWIRDWVGVHVRRQGVDGVLILDNGSETYRPEALDGMIGEIEGVSAHAVVPMPFLYGRIKARSGVKKAKFLQTAAFNLARLRFVAGAAGVLRLDIDEVAYSSGDTVFAATASTRSGYLSLPGQWCYIPPGHEGPIRHRDHRLVADPARTCHPKYCVIPDSFAGRRSWENHAIGPVGAAPLFRKPGFGFLHYRMLNTHRNSGNPRRAHTDRLVASPVAADLWTGL